MQLKKLSLNNFRNHKKTELQFEPLNLITGPEGAGKSSIRLAIMVALKGSIDLLDTRPLVMNGTEEARVKATFSRGKSERVIEKVIPRDPKRQMRTNLMNHKALLEFGGLDPDIAQIVCSTNEFVTMKKEDRIKALSKLVLGSITAKEIQEEVLEGLPETEREEAKVLLTKRIKIPEGTAPDALFKVFIDGAQAGRQAYRTLLSTKEQERDRESQNLRDLVETKSEETGVNIEDLKAWIETKKEKEILERELDPKQTKIKEIKDKKIQIEAALKNLGETDKQIKATENEQMELIKKKSILDDTILRKTNDLNELKGKVTSAPESANPLDIECPYFKYCRLPAGMLATLVTNKGIGQKEIDGIKAELEELTANSDDLGTQITEIQGKRRVLKDNKGTEESLKKDLELIQKAEDRTKEAASDIITKIEELKKAISGKDFTEESAKLLDGIKDEVTLETKTKLFDERIRKLSEEIKDMTVLEKRWDRIHKELKPKNARRRLIAKKSGDIESEISERVMSLTGIKETSFSDDMDIICNGVPVDYLSDSERYKVCIAIQHAICRTANAGIIIIDELNRIVDIEPIIEMISAIAQRGDGTVIAISADNRLVGKLPNCKPIHVKDGKISPNSDDESGPDSWDEELG